MPLESSVLGETDVTKEVPDSGGRKRLGDNRRLGWWMLEGSLSDNNYRSGYHSRPNHDCSETDYHDSGTNNHDCSETNNHDSGTNNHDNSTDAAAAERSRGRPTVPGHGGLFAAGSH